MKTFIVLLTVFVLHAAHAPLGHAQWSVLSTVNNAISTASGAQRVPTIASDGAGGCIITWYDLRDGVSLDIYAQRINSNGITQWTANGVAISTASGAQIRPEIVSDGSGGAIITWSDFRSGTAYDIYAQRVNASGVVQWTANGVAISTASDAQERPTIVSDGSGGAIITWEDSRNNFVNVDIYAQRVNASGVVQWTANGVGISTTSNRQRFPMIVRDNPGGAIITWEDDYNGTNYQVYAQRIDTSGVVRWTTNGVKISPAIGSHVGSRTVSYGPEGAIITWYGGDNPNGTLANIYAQRVNVSGVLQWTANGVAISIANGAQQSPTIISDSSGGAIITWHDLRSGTYDIYAQRIDASGVVQWTPDGEAISTVGFDQVYPTLVSDGAGGAIITWEDRRQGVSHFDIYAQRINASGIVPWMPNGVAISTADSVQRYPTIVSDGFGAAVVTWQDSRTDDDIYAQRVRSDGTLGGPTAVDDKSSAPTEFSLQQNYPNPFNPSTTIKYQIPPTAGGPNTNHVTLKVFDILGREVATLVNEELKAGSYEVQFSASHLASGICFYRLQAGDFMATKKMILVR